MDRAYRYSTKAIYGLILVTILISACATRNPNLVTPEGKAAARNTEIVKRVGELQNVTITANRDKQISDMDADLIVTWTTNTNRYLATNPSDPLTPTITSGWTGVVRPRAQKFPVLAPYVPIIDALLMEIK